MAIAVDADRFAAQTQARMSDPANPSDPRRLDELGAVTKAYATYSWRSGFAGALTGAWLLATLAMGAASVPGGRIARALAPGIWLALLPRAHAYYQRRGRVTEKEPAGAGEVGAGIFLWIWALIAPVGLLSENASWASSVGILGWALLVPAAGAFVAYPMLAHSRLRRGVDWALTALVVMSAANIAGQALSGVDRLGTIALGATMVAGGSTSTSAFAASSGASTR
jgi:hypothetical protein